LGSTEFNGTAYTALENSLYTAKQLAKKVLFMKTSFDGRMSATDAANMRANMMELHFLLGTIATVFTIGMAFSTDDKKNFRLNALINLINRQQQDISMFADPTQFESLSKNFIPSVGVFADIDNVLLAVKSELQGKGQFTTGVNKGQNKILVKLQKAIPIINQPAKWSAYNKDESGLVTMR
jgi:hypothetical protein